MSDALICQVTSPYFTAGFVIENGIVVEAAPIIRYLKGYTVKDAREYIESKGWKVTLCL